MQLVALTRIQAYATIASLAAQYPHCRLTQGRNDPEEGEYGWTTLMDKCARIEDALTLWNKDVDTLFVFVRDYHVALSSSNSISSLTFWSTDRLVLSGAYGVCSPSVM